MTTDDVRAVLARQLGESDADELIPVLDELAAGAAAVLGDGLLGEGLVGVYLVGSFALGAGDRASDVDVLVVSHEELDAEQESAAQDLHRRLHRLPSRWAIRLEGSWTSVVALRAAPNVGAGWLYVDNGSDELIRSPHENAWNTRWVLRTSGIALSGPAASTLVGAVPPDALRAEAASEAARKLAWIVEEPTALEDDWAQPYAVLSLCRLVVTAARGVVVGKEEAARWMSDGQAPAEFDALIDEAIDRRLSPGPSSPSERSRRAAGTSAFVQWAAAECVRCNPAR